MRINADTNKHFEDLLKTYKAELEHLKSYKAEWDNQDQKRYNNLLRFAKGGKQYKSIYKGL